MDKKTIILSVLFVITGIFFYILTLPDVELIEAKVVDVIDGDTVILASQERVRLKGINAPERGQSYYNEALKLLREKVLNKTVQIKAFDKDRYNRTLGYIYLDDENINALLLKEGFAHLYYYGSDSEYNLLKASESEAINSGRGLWRVSPYAGCLKLIELEYTESPTRCTNSETLKVQNTCLREFEITIKDDATHLYKGTILSNSTFERNFSCIFNDNGDSLYIRDQEYLLMFHRY